MALEIRSFIDVTYTGNGQQVHCSPVETRGSVPPEKLVLPAEVGETDVGGSRFYCGDVAIDLIHYVSTLGTVIEGNVERPSALNYRTTIEVVTDGGAGEHIFVYDEQGLLTIDSPSGGSPWEHTRIRSVPGTVIAGVGDIIHWNVDTGG
ncbi:MAG TPA: hypothetical protein VJR89_36240 [Polyangiales bacterium]|nr:hypothetical protein [Polyangiales bacterium]